MIQISLNTLEFAQIINGNRLYSVLLTFQHPALFILRSLSNKSVSDQREDIFMLTYLRRYRPLPY
jgi:hypothetical protein